MKVLILSYGTRGDVQPYVAIGKGLQAAGHEVMIGTSVRFQKFVEDHGFAYGYLNDEILSFIDTPEGKKLIETGANVLSMIRIGLKFAKIIKPAQHAMMHECWEIAKAFQPDLILFHPKTLAAPHIAEKLSVPVALLTPFPMQVATSEFPMLVFPKLPLGGWYNRLTYQFGRFMTNKSLGGYIRELRESLELPPLKKYDSSKMPNGLEVPVMHLFSPSVIPRPADWPESAQITGYCFLDHDEEWSPPTELSNFLAEGPPPVYIGFGSMAGSNPEQLADIAIQALQQNGLRGILATGWGGLNADDLPDSILKIEKAPHDWLFPQTAAVVHHGGAGTTAAGLRAGKPTIIVPFFGDQPFWAKRIFELGVGPQCALKKRLTAEKLSNALKQATTDQKMIAKADELGEAIRSEDGVACLVQHLTLMTQSQS